MAEEPVSDGAAARVAFYVLPGDDARARLKLACRLAEKAYLDGQRVFVWSEDRELLAAFDELLWSFADRSFVPHEPYTQSGQWQHTAVLLGSETQPDAQFDLLLNLGMAVPAAAAHAHRVIELIDGEHNRRQAGRARFRSYRERGLTLETHNLTAEQLA